MTFWVYAGVWFVGFVAATPAFARFIWRQSRDDCRGANDWATPEYRRSHCLKRHEKGCWGCANVPTFWHFVYGVGLALIWPITGLLISLYKVTLRDSMSKKQRKKSQLLKDIADLEKELKL